METQPIKIGVVGTGFIARGFVGEANRRPEISIESVLTRRNPESVKDLSIPNSKLTSSIDCFIEKSELIIECCGDPVYATPVVWEALKAQRPVVTLDAELHVTTGSWLKKFGYLTEAHGDQPGVLAALNEEVREMGFRPRVYGNIKGFLNENPTLADMKYWSMRNGISLNQVTSFTDGTKIHIEQVLVANGLKAEILPDGLSALFSEDVKSGAVELAMSAQRERIVLSDYILSPKSPAGVFIVAEHSDDQADYLKYYKVGEDGLYVLLKPYHLCHLEIFKTLGRVLKKNPPLLDNGENPRYSVASIAKKVLPAGSVIMRGLGSFEVRGKAVDTACHPEHLPIGLMSDVRLTRQVEPGQMLTFSDVEMPDTLALKAWKESMERSLVNA